MKSLQLAKPHVIVVVGIPGAGKTFFAEQFSKTFSAPFLDFTTIRTLTGNQQSAEKAWHYILEQLFLTKQTIILETAATTITERRSLATLVRQKGYQILFVWVQTEPHTAQLRSTKGTPGQDTSQLITKADFEKENKRFQPLTATEKYIVISGKHTYASQAKNVLKRLTEPRAESSKKPQLAERPKSLDRQGRITVT